MYWAMHHRPHLIGNTKTPALHWWTNNKAERCLKAAGFNRVWTRWELRQLSECTKTTQLVVRLAKRTRTFQCLLDMFIPGCSYAASKSNIIIE